LKEKHDAWSMIDEFSSKSDELGQDVTQIDVYNALRDEYLSERFKFGDGFIPSRDAFDKGFNLWVRGYDNEGYEDAYNEYQYLAGKYGFGLDNNKYRELSGEVEARNVQSRMNMTPEKRQNSLASETENVARENQIFLNGALRGVSAFMDTSIEEVSRRFNEELNAFEHGYIYQKYRLGEKEECRKKLARILADAGKNMQEAGNYGIGREEYQAVKRKKLWSAIQWKVTHWFDRKDTLCKEDERGKKKGEKGTSY